MAQDADKVIKQAISDFDSMKEFLEACGIAIPYDTDTSKYPDKMGEALALAYAAAINECPVKKLVSPDSEGNYVDQFSLESGAYICEGEFIIYPNVLNDFANLTGELCIVQRDETATYCLEISALGGLIFKGIWADDTLEAGYGVIEKVILVDKLESIENKVSQITDYSQDYQYPNVPAVKAYVDKRIGYAEAELDSIIELQNSILEGGA